MTWITLLNQLKVLKSHQRGLENFYLKLIGIDWLLCMPLAVLVLNVNQGMYFLIGEFCFSMRAKIVIDDKALCFHVFIIAPCSCFISYLVL